MEYARRWDGKVREYDFARYFCRSVGSAAGAHRTERNQFKRDHFTD